jgi:ubiquinone/menaquinone biosynthesis C-methylase UbiE
VLEIDWSTRARQRWQLTTQAGVIASKQLLRSVTRSTRRLPEVRVVEYENDRGENIVAIVNSFGDTRGAPAVVIPPAWGRTKETLLALAETVVATFRAAQRPVTVIRFDGIRKRGESYNDPDCRQRGKEHHHFTFHQGVDDVIATLDFLERSCEFQPSTSILVTFSAASIEGRRVAMLEGGMRIGGWVCVVGAADIQAMMRVISGGVDFAAGFERGVRFGFQEILGVVVDIDHAGVDAIEKKLTFLDDSRRDFAQIDIPITWYHGEHDAWMNLERVREVLAEGDSSKRCLVQVPTGHQLKSSRKALELFQAIAVEIGRMATGETLRPALPDLAALEAKHQAERKRRPPPVVDVRRFWRDYLVGRDGALGIELMTDKSAYRGLIATQIEQLHLRAGDRVADLGSGMGPLPLALASSVQVPLPLEIHEVDYVHEALERARQRLVREQAREGFVVRFLEADLDLKDRGCSIPLRSGSYDAVLASLVLSYVADPSFLLQEIRRLLRPGGRLVVSSLRCDADISKLWVDGLAEHREALGRREIGEEDSSELKAVGREFLNDAARLLDLEEDGMFRFWEDDQLERLIHRAGFRKIETHLAFGNPPQALVLAAQCP